MNPFFIAVLAGVKSTVFSRKSESGFWNFFT